jgi:hypothetical protein
MSIISVRACDYCGKLVDVTYQAWPWLHMTLNSVVGQPFERDYCSAQHAAIGIYLSLEGEGRDALLEELPKLRAEEVRLRSVRAQEVAIG